MITASVQVTNIGNVTGTETVQLYIRDVHAYGLSRPIKELKGFKQVVLLPKESVKVSFVINTEMLRFYDIDMRITTDAGVYEAYIGSSSNTMNVARFCYEKESV